MIIYETLRGSILFSEHPPEPDTNTRMLILRNMCGLNGLGHYITPGCLYTLGTEGEYHCPAPNYDRRTIFWEYVE